MSTRTTEYEFELQLKDVIYVVPHTMPHTVLYPAGHVFQVTCEVEYDYESEDSPAHAVHIGATVQDDGKDLSEPIHPNLVKLIDAEVDDLLSRDENLIPCWQIKEEDALSAHDDEGE